ncbi:GntR family transcriptional regulator [Roseobacter sinensis]|uniref:GntR family transcriptional regulator n=1 Tax=Roseobacter sinensis TaxID=2931391 RepID=A0ABT3BE62_9RHOB|nr:GntR family transcriptional regulator [Roseobacter sp. WL0113]MCV3271843.1 GntR family transcriptional regulator [Roseobacter sp. WL0113]
MADEIWTNELREFVELKPRRSLASEAADNLREFIMLGKLAPGMPVRERDLASAFGISRTPLKEALRILESEGLIVYGPTRRPFVADPSLREINDWLRVQGALEALAGELACGAATDAELDEIARINASIKEARDADGQLEAFRRDMTFHEAIVAASGNAALRETHASYNARLWRVRFLSSQRLAGREATRREHLEIVEALKARDVSAARRALTQHLRTAETNIAAAMAEATEQEGA